MFTLNREYTNRVENAQKAIDKSREIQYTIHAGSSKKLESNFIEAETKTKF
jgi:hypothetical protein